MGYRENYFKCMPSRNGYYQCVRCGGWFPKNQIDIDHKIAKRLGGTDDIWNLQAMCYHCNRSKGKNTSSGEVASTVFNAGVQGLMSGGANGAVVNLTRIAKGVAGQKVKDALGIKYRRG